MSSRLFQANVVTPATHRLWVNISGYEEKVQDFSRISLLKWGRAQDSYAIRQATVCEQSSGLRMIVTMDLCGEMTS